MRSFRHPRANTGHAVEIMSHSGLGHLSILWQRVATADECLDVSASPEAFKDLFQFVKDFSSFCHNPYGSQTGGALHVTVCLTCHPRFI